MTYPQKANADTLRRRPARCYVNLCWQIFVFSGLRQHYLQKFQIFCRVFVCLFLKIANIDIFRHRKSTWHLGFCCQISAYSKFCQHLYGVCFILTPTFYMKPGFSPASAFLTSTFYSPQHFHCSTFHSPQRFAYPNVFAHPNVFRPP